MRELILKGEIGKIHDVMEQNNSIGMCTFDQSLMNLYQDGLITEETAITNSDKPSDMKIKIQQAQLVSESRGSKNALDAVDTSLLSFSD